MPPFPLAPNRHHMQPLLPLNPNRQTPQAPRVTTLVTITIYLNLFAK